MRAFSRSSRQSTSQLNSESATKSEKSSPILLSAFLLLSLLLPFGSDSSKSVYGASADSSPNQKLVVQNKDIAVTVTSSDKKLVTDPNLLHWRNGGEAQGADTVVINPDKKYQKILGFGGAFTDATCYTLNQMPEDVRQKLITELFDSSSSKSGSSQSVLSQSGSSQSGSSQSGLGLNVCRVCMGSSDYSTKVYSYDDGETDPELKRFSIAFDKEYILPTLRRAIKTNPDLFLFATPWSPPGWMKAGRSMLGGCMRREFMPAYANYFAKFLHAYAAEGVSIGAVTVQNEVDTDQDGRMPACSWPQEYEADFAARYLGPTLSKENLSTQIWVIDHNYNLWGRAIGELETPNVRKYVTGIAWHGYLGDASKMTAVHDLFPDINMHWTEGGPDITAKDYMTDWGNWSRSFTGIFRNWCKSVTAWNLALDEAGKPNLGPFPCGGMVTVNSKTKEITRSGQFYAMAQFSKFVKRGAVRIDSHDSQGEIAKVTHVAFQNPDGLKVLVLTNGGAQRQIGLQIGGQSAKVSLEPDSVNTLTWY
jgi:glucosylceramidase